MKYIAVLLAGLLMSFFSSAAEKVLNVVTEAWPPFIIELPGGKPSGFDYEVSEAVLRQMGYTMNIRFLPWKRVLAAVTEKEADAVLGIIENEERHGFLFFPATPLSMGGNALFFKLGKSFEYTGLESLKGKTVGTMQGYTYSDEFDKATSFTKVPQTGSDGVERNLRKLLADRIDLMIDQKNVVLYTAKSLGILDQIGYSENYVTDQEGNFLAFSKKAGNEELAKTFGDNLKLFKTSPEYQIIMSKYGQ